MELSRYQQGNNDDLALPNVGELVPVTLKPLAFDAKDYWHDLDGLDISDEQRIAFLETLWNIMSTFVNLAFGADPVHHVLPALVKAAWEDGNIGRQHFNQVAADQTIKVEGIHHE